MENRQHKSYKIAYKVNLHVFFTLNTISCFIMSRGVKAEAMEEVKFLWKRKRKHFDEKDWKRKQTLKRLILSGAGSGSKKPPKARKRKRTRKHKTSRGAGSGSIKNLTASTSQVFLSILHIRINFLIDDCVYVFFFSRWFRRTINLIWFPKTFLNS